MFYSLKAVHLALFKMCLSVITLRWLVHFCVFPYFTDTEKTTSHYWSLCENAFWKAREKSDSISHHCELKQGEGACFLAGVENLLIDLSQIKFVILLQRCMGKRDNIPCNFYGLEENKYSLCINISRLTLLHKNGYIRPLILWVVLYQYVVYIYMHIYMYSIKCYCCCSRTSYC